MNASVLGVGGLLGWWEVNSERRDCSSVRRSACCGVCVVGPVWIPLGGILWLRVRAEGIFVRVSLLGRVENGQMGIVGLRSRSISAANIDWDAARWKIRTCSRYIDVSMCWVSCVCEQLPAEKNDGRKIHT